MVKSIVKSCLGFVLSSILAISLQIFFFSPISPVPLSLPSPSSIFPSNAILQGVTKLGEGILNRPEGICVDKKGILYTASRDGWIKRMFKNGTWDNWMMLGTDSLLGITVTSTGHLIVCDAEQGLLKIGEDGASVLVSHANGSKIRLRCLKYWLKGEIRGQTEIFIDNLPGGPDNINLAPDGSFWIALPQITKEGLEFVHTSKIAKHIIATFPKLLKFVSGFDTNAVVVNVGKDGKIVKMFDDPIGKVISFVTSALEFEDNLYLGSLNTDFIGKLPLKSL